MRLYLILLLFDYKLDWKVMFKYCLWLGLMLFFEFFDLSFVNWSLLKFIENLCLELLLLSVSFLLNVFLLWFCEDLLNFGWKNGKIILLVLLKFLRMKLIGDFMEDFDLIFIIWMLFLFLMKVKFNFKLIFFGFKFEYCWGLFDFFVMRDLDRWWGMKIDSFLVSLKSI